MAGDVASTWSSFQSQIGTIRGSLALNEQQVSEEPNLEKQFQTFAFLMACGVLFHQSILSDWEPFSHHMLPSLAAIVVVTRPWSIVTFLVMIAMHLVSVLIDLPYVVNHWIFVGVLDIGIFSCAIGAAVKKRSCRITGGELMFIMGPVIRWSVLAMYSFAALAKLNSDFFKPELSAAVALYGELSDKVMDMLPQETWAFHMVIWGTAALECSLPWLLLIPRTRLLGIALAFGFHFAMGVSGFIPFSGFAMAFLFLFMPQDLIPRFEKLKANNGWLQAICDGVRRVFQTPWPAAFMFVTWFLIACTRTHAWLSPDMVRLAVIRVGQLAFALYYTGVATLVLWMYLPSILRRESLGPPAPLRLANPVFAIVPLLVIVNALCPYVGLKTESSFTMYSNLQTEGSQWNHLIMPESMQVFDWQDDLVQIIDSNHPPYQRAAKEDIRLTWFEFHRQTSEADSISVTYQRGDEVFEVADSANDPKLSNPPHFLMRKALWFREVPVPEKNTIRH